MMPAIEIIIPIRNPSDVLLESIRSLAAQNCREFRVTLSDNHSSTGSEYLEQAEGILSEAGIPFRRISPPRELGRVEHWNWAFHQADTEWVKPLFAGDSFFPFAIGKFQTAVKNNPGIRFFFSSYIYCAEGKETVPTHITWAGKSSAEKMRKVVIKHGMQFGPPSGVLFQKSLFVVLGGFPPGLPITADCLLFCRMAAHSGAYGFSEPLFRFNIHGGRFSKSLPSKRKETLAETWNYRMSLLYYAWTQGWNLHLVAFTRSMLKSTLHFL
jgi:glycosyltransferase involved in cell wall biosynthesis